MKGEDLKTWRLSIGLTRAQVAKELGVSARTVEAWEQSSKITPRSAAQIEGLQQRLDVLRIPIDDELRKKLREIALRKGVTPEEWATDLLKKVL